MNIIETFRRGRMNGYARTKYEKKIGKEKWITLNGKVGRWITIGGNGGSGGSHVFIGKKGEIIFGNKRLTGKKLGNNGQRGLFDDPEGAREHALARHSHVAEVAKKEGISDEDLHAVVDGFRAHDQEFVHDAHAMIRDAKRQIPELRDMKKLEGKDYTHIPNFDVVARELAGQYPGLLGPGYEMEKNADAGDDQSSEKLWNYLQAGPPQPMSEQEAYEKALTTLLENKHENPDEEAGGINDEGADVGDFDFGEPDAKEPEKAAEKPTLESTTPDELVSNKKKTQLDLSSTSPDELAASLGKQSGKETPAPAAKEKVSPAEANSLFSQLPTDKATGYPKIVTEAASWIKSKNPSADEHELLSHAAEAVYKTALSMNKGDDLVAFEHKAKASIKNALTNEYKAKTAQKRGSGNVRQMPEDFDAEQRKDKGPSSNDIQEAVSKLDDQQRAIVQGMLDGKSQAEIAAEMGLTGATLNRRWQEAKKVLGPALAYQLEGDKERYGRVPILPQVWEEIIQQSRQYGPMAPEFVRSVMEAMQHADSQWEAIVKGRQAYLSRGSQRHERDKEEKKYKFSSTQFNITDGTAAKAIRAMSDSIPDSDLSEEGREDKPHITIKYGLHTDNASKIAKIVKGFGPVKVRLGTTKIFPAKESDSQRGGESQDVVYVSVESDSLRELNQLISDSLECTDTHPSYVPHVCLAYTKPGSGQKYVGMVTVDGEEIEFDELMFSSVDKEKTTISLMGKESRKYEYGPRHSPPKRIDGAVARLEALSEYSGDIDDEALEDEVTGIAREFSAEDLKAIARKFGIKKGISTKAATLDSLLAKVCKSKE